MAKDRRLPDLIKHAVPSFKGDLLSPESQRLIINPVFASIVKLVRVLARSDDHTHNCDALILTGLYPSDERFCKVLWRWLKAILCYRSGEPALLAELMAKEVLPPELSKVASEAIAAQRAHKKRKLSCCARLDIGLLLHASAVERELSKSEVHHEAMSTMSRHYRTSDRDQYLFTSFVETYGDSALMEFGEYRNSCGQTYCADLQQIARARAVGEDTVEGCIREFRRAITPWVESDASRVVENLRPHLTRLASGVRDVKP